MTDNTFSGFDLWFILDELMDESNAPKESFTFGGTSALVLKGMRKGCAVAQIWVERSIFVQICERERVINHAMTDTLVVLEREPTDHRPMRVEIRERNDYFPSVELGEEPGFLVFDDLTLLIQKRNEWTECVEQSEPKERIESVMTDIRELNAILAEKNKVREVA